MTDVALTMTADQARELTERAKDRVEQANAMAEAAVILVEQVIAADGHKTLGYESPSQYLRAEFNVAALQFSATERRDMALMLVRNGVSKRGAAQVLGVSDVTVRRDLSNATSDALPERVETSDGRSFPLSMPAQPSAPASVSRETGLISGDDWVQAPGPGPEVAVTPPQPAPEQPKPKRPPLPEAFLVATLNLTKAAESLVRLTSDDRFTRNRDQAHHQMPELLGALNHTTRLMQALNLPAAEASEEARRWWATSLNTISDALTGVANSITKDNSHV